jgi:O-antigen/teichoic acid export membrane protein
MIAMTGLFGRLASVPAFFGIRVLSGLLLLKLSASFLPVSGFAIFSQLLSFSALLNLIAIGGAQNGLIRQAAAAADDAALTRARSAALAIWLGVAPTLILGIALASAPISNILIGDRREWLSVIAIAFLVLAAGPGQIWCSLLSGRKHVAHSLAAQAIGLLAGTCAAAFFIRRGDPAAAAVGFASGPMVTMAMAIPIGRRLGIGRTSIRAAGQEVRTLLRYSAALATTTGASSILLFGLRFLYREHFGATQLGYWVAANRISDMSTQLLGLFMVQFFVPHFAMEKNEPARRALIIRCWLIATATMATILIVFSLTWRPVVHLLLSDAYLPAVTMIRAYMAGDFLRVWISFAMYAAFARGRPDRYAGMEVATWVVMALIVGTLISVGNPNAPQIGYVCAYGLAAAITTAAFLWRPAEVLRLKAAPLR